MAYQSIWYYTDIPQEIIFSIEEDIKKFDQFMVDSKLRGDVINHQARNSKNSWIPTTHCVSGFLWHYISRANRENFLYDLTNIDGESLQYTQYGHGEYYKWHTDAGLATLYKPDGLNVGSITEQSTKNYINQNSEFTRKLSFSLLLSDPNEYSGGNLQLLDESGQSYFAPRKRGTIVLFDSRSQHRVTKVTGGTRKSIVGWVIGPRWK